MLIKIEFLLKGKEQLEDDWEVLKTLIEQAFMKPNPDSGDVNSASEDLLNENDLEGCHNAEDQKTNNLTEDDEEMDEKSEPDLTRNDLKSLSSEINSVNKDNIKLFVCTGKFI